MAPKRLGKVGEQSTRWDIGASQKNCKLYPWNQTSIVGPLILSGYNMTVLQLHCSVTNADWLMLGWIGMIIFGFD